MLSPTQGHKDYQRFKYYSALRTGYAHLGLEQPPLEAPVHIIDQALFLFQVGLSKFLIIPHKLIVFYIKQQTLMRSRAR